MYNAAATAEIKPHSNPSREIYNVVKLPWVVTRKVPSRQDRMASHYRFTGSFLVVMQTNSNTRMVDKYCSTVAVPELLLVMDVR